MNQEIVATIVRSEKLQRDQFKFSDYFAPDRYQYARFEGYLEYDGKMADSMDKTGKVKAALWINYKKGIPSVEQLKEALRMAWAIEIGPERTLSIVVVNADGIAEYEGWAPLNPS